MASAVMFMVLGLGASLGIRQCFSGWSAVFWGDHPQQMTWGLWITVHKMAAFLSFTDTAWSKWFGPIDLEWGSVCTDVHA